MKIKEVKSSLKSEKISGLKKLLNLEYEKLAKARIEISSKKTKDNSIAKKTKRQIARIITFINQKLEEENV